MRLLFVCTGNSCRSPMAVGLARRILPDAGIDAEVDSAGLSPEPSVTDLAVEAMHRRGIYIENHRPRRVQPNMAGQADLVLCMEERHRSGVKRLVQDEGKVFTLAGFVARAKKLPLSDFAGTTSEWVAALNAEEPEPYADVRDPMEFGTEEAYETTAAQLNDLITELGSVLRPQGRHDSEPPRLD